jgi:hypothetical protein
MNRGTTAVTEGTRFLNRDGKGEAKRLPDLQGNGNSNNYELKEILKYLNEPKKLFNILPVIEKCCEKVNRNPYFKELYEN